MPRHTIVQSGSTQYIVLESSKERLRTIIEQNMAFVFDLSGSHINALLTKGRTSTTDMLTGQRRVVTLTFCDCDDPESHRRPDASQLA